MEKYKDRKIGEIVTHDFRAADIFRNAGIDFCCGGNQSLEEACNDKKMEVSMIEKKCRFISDLLDKNFLGLFFISKPYSPNFLKIFGIIVKNNL